MPRKFPRKIKRIVVKLGSSVIATDTMKPRISILRSLVDQVFALKNKNVEVIFVSSGAIVLGMGAMDQKNRPQDLASLQALAAVGQTVLMKRYKDLFKSKKQKCAQVLLTWDDFDNRARYNNARNTFKAMLEWGIVPIVNENDTISTDEIKFGDNDKLSALVASLVQADLLVLLSDVEGLYDINSKSKKIFREIKEITSDIEGLASDTSNKNFSKGGMLAKLEAIKIATHARIPCVIAHAETKNVLQKIVKGEEIGTLFLEKEEKLLARKHWISFGAKPKGIVTIDDGAKKAVTEGKKSLLLPGITDSEGSFQKGDVVVICDCKGNEICRGIINYSSQDLNKIEDKKGKLEAIHCDNLVFSKR